MLSKIARKLKNSEVTMTDPDAEALVNSLWATLNEYALFFGKQFEDEAVGIFDDFVEKFLMTQAYVGPKDGNIIYSYDPFELAYSETKVDPEHGPIKQWVAYYTNCFVMYSEFPDTPEKSDIVLAMDRDTYAIITKTGESLP